MAEQTAQLARAAHAVPLVAQPARGQAEGVVRIGRLGQRLPGQQGKACAAIGRGKAAVFVEPCAALGCAFGQRPLLGALRVQQIPGQAGDVQVTPARALAVLVPDGLGAGSGVFGVVGKEAGPARAQPCLHAPRAVHGNAPVMARGAGCGHGGAHARDAPFAVGHRADLLAPGGGGQQQVGVGAGGGGGKGLLHDDEFGPLQRAPHQGLVGHALRRVGAGYPQRADLALGGGLEHLHGGLAGAGRHGVHAPQCGHFGAVGRVGQVAVGRQQIGQPAHLAPAHGIGLARERERPCACAPDLARGQVQADQRGVLGRAVAALVQALAVQAERGATGGAVACIPAQRKPLRGLEQIVPGQAAELAHALGRGLPHQGLQVGKAAGVACDVGQVQPAFQLHDVQHAVEQQGVAAGAQRQEEVGHAGRVGAARVGHDDLHLRPRGTRLLDAPREHGMRPGRVAARDEKAVRMVHILVAGRWRVGAQRELVAGHGAAHAQARIGVDVVGADQALGQLVEDVVVLGQQLAAHIQAHGVGAVLLHDGGQPAGGQVQCGIPAHILGRRAARGTQRGLQQPRLPCQGGRGRQVQGAALGAQAAVVGGVRRIATHARDARTIAFDEDAAAYAAIGAGGSGFLHGGPGVDEGRAGHGGGRRHGPLAGSAWLA